VVKIGSSLFASEKDGLNTAIFNNIANQIINLVDAGKEVAVVSSGAIAMGMRMLGLKTRPKELSHLQAAAAIGQNALMDSYSTAFKKHNLICAQVLLTWDDFNDRRRYLNAKNTLLTLLKLKSIPVINENDTVSTDEIRFGDNDQLSARVASLISADRLIILSDVEGLLDREKKVIPVIDEITSAVKALANPTNKQTSVGGMITKLEAAKIATDAGVTCTIAGGKNHDSILRSITESAGTLFLARKGYTAEKKRWIAFGTKSKGKIIVDDGAKIALLGKKSLLSVGITGSEGNFDSGDIVSITNKHGVEFARGKTTLSSKQVDKVKGVRADKEVIHCDNIVILN
jgi:glutamate 5-kinase